MFDTLFHRWLRVPYTLNVRLVKRPKKAKATLLFIHGIGNTGDAWNDVINNLPNDLRIVTIDLLGFGDSPSPAWAVYNAKTQARMVMATYVKLRIASPVIIVGHSLGALVAVEIAKRYPLLVQSLVLCSPPLYDSEKVSRRFRPSADKALRRMYRTAAMHPENFLRISALAARYKLVNKSFNLTTKNVASYMAALESMIINQTSLNDAMKLRKKMYIIRGTLDPVVVHSNLKKLAKYNGAVELSSVIAGHEVVGRYVKAVVKIINKATIH